VRVVRARELRRTLQPLRRHRLADGDGAGAGAHLVEHLGHARFQVQPDVEDHVRPEEAAHVALAGLVQVRVHPGPHQRVHPHPLAAHVAHHVGHHAHGGDGVEPAVGVRGRRWRAGSGREQRQTPPRPRSTIYIVGSDPPHTHVTESKI
jgi:hypothetical protein